MVLSAIIDNSLDFTEHEIQTYVLLLLRFIKGGDLLQIRDFLMIMKRRASPCRFENQRASRSQI